MATNSCRNTIKRMDCGGKLPTQQPNKYPPFEVCLPFGKKLEFDGTGFIIKQLKTIPDGKYGLVVVENNCITDFEEQPVCEYTAQPCTPAVSPCGDSSSSVPLQPGQNNLLNYDASGRLGGQLYVSSSSLSVSGYGTSSSPLRIEYTPTSVKTYIRSGSDIVGVDGAGESTSPYVITHGTSALSAGVYGVFTVDKYGHVIGYDSSQVMGITALIEGGGVKLTKNGTAYTIALNQYASVSDTYTLGGISLTLDGYGIVTNSARVIDLPPTTDDDTVLLDPENYTLTFNTMGSLIGFTAKDVKAADEHFTTIFEPQRESTSMVFSTKKAGFFLIRYRGSLDGVSEPSSSTYGYYALPSTYYVLVNNRRTNAYGLYMNGRLVEIVALTDAYYGLGDYTVTIARNNPPEGWKFPDGALMSVELVQRPT